MNRKIVAILVAVAMVCSLSLAMSFATVPQASAASDAVLWLEVYEVYSCPYLFTWDGLNYQVENDVYTARGEAQEFTDYLYIKNAVVPKDGVYSFEIREIRTEQSWTDMVKLITIDHPAGVNVGVDSAGNVHSYVNPSSPDSAVDGGGGDVLSLINVRDSSAIDMYHGDTVVLDFSSVDINAGAKLVMNLDGFEGELEGDPTFEVPAIRIQTLESGQWVTRHEFRPKTLWVEGVFDLKPYLTESKTVRLEAVSCDQGKYHRIDYAGLDNTADALSSSVLEPSSAVLNGLDNVLAEVIGSDDVYAHMEQDDIIVVAFPFSPLTDEVRDFAFVSEGYYEPVGLSFYVDTWNGSSWVQQAQVQPPILFLDTVMQVPLGLYLPDPDHEFKVRLRHVIEGTDGEEVGKVDQVYLVVNAITYPPSYAKEQDTTDILSLVTDSDDVKWDASDNWAIIKFNVPVGGIVEPVNLSELGATSAQLSDGNTNDALVALWIGLASALVVGGGILLIKRRRVHQA